jgi:hypothetical protein
VLRERAVPDVPQERAVLDVPQERVVPDVPQERVVPDVLQERVVPDVPLVWDALPVCLHAVNSVGPGLAECDFRDARCLE